MGQIRRHLLPGAIAAIGALCCAASAQSAIIFTDAAAFDAALDRLHIESFESLALGAPPAGFAFDSTLQAGVATSGAMENRIEHLTDGHGAIAADGDRFWKLRGGSATISLSGPAVNAFGFHYSDLEQATLRVSALNGAFQPFDLDDDNSDANHFIGVIGTADIDAVRIEWMASHGDGVGIDGLRFGHAAVIPTPRSITLGLAGFALFAWPRRREG